MNLKKLMYERLTTKNLNLPKTQIAHDPLQDALLDLRDTIMSSDLEETDKIITLSIVNKCIKSNSVRNLKSLYNVENPVIRRKVKELLSKF